MWTDVGEHLPADKKLRWIHDHLLEPGVSIGLHEHVDDEEYYYVLAGSGTLIMDGEEHPVQAGDLAAVYPGGRHGIKNTSDQTMRLLVISINQ